MAKKSTKTAHVLNLISKAAPEPQEPAKNMDDTISKPEQPAASPIHSSLTQNTKNDEISKQIKDSLLQELGLQETTEENEQIETTAKDTPATDAPAADHPVSENTSAIDAPATDHPVSEDTPIDAPVADHPVSEDTPAIDAPVADHAVSEDTPAIDAPATDHPVSEDTPADAPVADDVVSEESNTERIAEIENISEIEDKTSEVSLEDQIAESLSAELTEELQPASIQPVPHTTPIKDVLTDFSAKPASVDMAKQNIEETVSVQKEDAALPSTPTSAASPVANSVTASAPETAFRYINIYEELVKEQLAEYMEKFHVCTCNRCTMDTMALTLSNLPSKYAVIDANLKAPFLNYCSIKLGIEIMTELTKACLVVAAHPRHTPADLEAKKE